MVELQASSSAEWIRWTLGLTQIYEEICLEPDLKTSWNHNVRLQTKLETEHLLYKKKL